MNITNKKNRQIILEKRPVGMPKESDFSLIEKPIPEIKHGEVLIKIIWLSLDPYMRGRMSTAKSYAQSLEVGDVITAGAVGIIEYSKSNKFSEGDIVEGFTLGWQEYVVTDTSLLRKIDSSLGPIQTAVGVLGMPGMTAYFGLFNIGKPVPGDTVVVSAASGAVGQIVGQLARLAGCYVVGIAGGKDKCDYIKNIQKFDQTIDYKHENVFQKLNDYCPNGIDVYFDNVGGVITDSVVNNLAPYARVAVCGVISQYNLTEAEPGLRTHRAMLTNQATTEGFLVFQFAQKYPIARKRLASWLKEKKIIWKEDIREGLESAPVAFIDLMNGKNFGKLLIKISD